MRGRNLSGTRSLMALANGADSMAYANCISAHKKHMTTMLVSWPKIRVNSAHNSPPATIHGVRRPSGVRVRSDSAETSGVNSAAATTPTMTNTASGMASSVATGKGRPVTGLMVTCSTAVS